MSSTVSGPKPLAVDLNVLKLGTTEDPVNRDDVERALYALTGWAKPQLLVDAALDVIDSYATAVRASRVVPARSGHDVPAVAAGRNSAVVVCGRDHLDEHTCPAVEVKTVEVMVEVPVEVRVPVLGAMAVKDRVWARSDPTMSPEELLLVDEADVHRLTDAQRGARDVLVAHQATCSMCSMLKSLDDFYKDSSRLTRRSSRCKDCANTAAAARRRAKTPG